ncbi:MAG: ABC transporter ATP-binding protein/permease, partial [Anaeroplasmataceae bacterium]|nr:ABC transporter ATP-binding protein/permease [Anaeroplasmataceae bacterium]
LHMAIGRQRQMCLRARLLNNIQTPLLTFSSLWNQFNLAQASKKRIQTVYTLTMEEQAELPEDFDSIVFDHVSFAYRDDLVIKDFTFEIKKDEIVLFQGPSGIGKTTVFMLLMGFLKPDEGEIYMKYKNEKFSVPRKLFSYVPQENILFSGSIAENIYILTGKNKEEAIWALKLTNIYDELLELPEGLDTVLKERGSGLSLGQIQRIWIAIALLRDRPVLLLDEFSSALDSKNEEEIMDRLTKLNKTIIFISHRNKEMENQRVIPFIEV